MNEKNSSLPNLPLASDPGGAAISFADAPGPTLCGDFDIRIDRHGTWYYHGSAIRRGELVKLFATVLSRDGNGDYWLTTPAERGRIEVEDLPFLAVGLSVSGGGRDQVVVLTTNIDETVTIGRENPLKMSFHPDTGEPAPSVVLGKGIEARIVRSLYYELVDLGREERDGNEIVYGIWSGGTFFPLGKLDPES